MDCTLEKECSALGGLFQSIVNDLKNAHPVWDDFAQKATKLHVQLKITISTLNLFLDALQKIADMATAAKGATRDIGTALTRICMRHRSVENRLKTLCSALIDCLVQPLMSRIDDWHKTAVQMDKDHVKDYKRCKHEIKKRTRDTNQLQKKLRRGQTGVQRMLESATQEVNDRYMSLLDTERAAARHAMIEQRAQYCLFVSWFKPVMEGETALIGELNQMNEVMELLSRHSGDPYTLPAASEAVIMDAKGLETTWRFQSPPSSPGASTSSSLGSRKSSFCSLNSSSTMDESTFNESSSKISNNKSPVISKTVTKTNDAGKVRYSSLSSHDSGFTSQDTLYGRQKSPPTAAAAIYVQPPRFNSDEEDDSTPASSTPSPSPSAATWPAPHEQDGCASAEQTPRTTPNTISSVYASDCATKRPPLTRTTFTPPRPTALFKKSPYNIDRPFDEQYIKEISEEDPQPPNNDGDDCNAMPNFDKNCQKFYGDTPAKPNIPNFNQALPDQRCATNDNLRRSDAVSLGPILSMRSMPPPQQSQPNSVNGRLSRRPLSFVAPENFDVTAARDDDEDTLIGDCNENSVAYQQIDRFSKMSRSAAGDDSRTTLFHNYHNNGESSTMAFCTLPRLPKCSGENCACTHNLETDSFSQYQNHGFENLMKNDDYDNRTSMMNTIVRRPSAASSAGGRPPPPPTRRNSAITSATPNAPAVDVVRSNSRCTTPVDGYGHVPIYGTSIITQQQIDISYSNQAVGRSPDVGGQMMKCNGGVSHDGKTFMQIRSSLRVKNPAENRNRSVPRV